MYYTPEHEAFRDSIRRFVAEEITPFVDQWDEAESFPRALYKKAADAGVLGLGFPEEYGGIPTPDRFYHLIWHEEMSKAGSGGVVASLLSLSIAVPPIIDMGTDAQIAKFVPSILSGDKISALAITEPSGGSDVANLKTVAKRDGDEYVINGTKTFITSGVRADILVVAVRTADVGMKGISLLVVPGDTPGLSRTPLKKMGWWCSDTATLYFDNCRVPASNLIGEENLGFIGVMKNFNNERLGLAAQAYSLGKVCLDEAVAYAQERHTFGKPLIKNQVIRHKLVDMSMKLNAVKAYTEALTHRCSQGDVDVAELCMVKNLATTTCEYCANEAMQVFGGAGYLRGSTVERIYRETKVMTIGGGSAEILKDLAARQLGW